MDRISRFLELYNSKYTRSSYQLSLKHFFGFIYQGGNQSLNEQGEKYFSEKRNYEEDIEKFSQSINSKPPKTIRLMLSTVKTFFIENDIELSDKFWKRTRRRIKGSRALTIDKVPSNEELKKILSHMSIEGKALFLVLASSGMRIGESLKLKLSDLEDGTPYKIKIRGEYTKSGNSRITFISKEAVLFLNEWLKVRLNRLENGKTRLHASREEERIFPYRVQTAYYMWRNALKQSGYMKRDSSTNRMTIHPHVLRKFYRTRLGSIIPVDIVETFMGHEGYLTEVYRKYQDDPEAMGEFYMQGEHVLTVFGSSEDVNKLREEVKEENKQLQSLVNVLATENINLKNENADIKNRLSEVEKEVRIIKDLIK